MRQENGKINMTEPNFIIAEENHIVQISVSGNILEYDCERPLQMIKQQLSSDIKQIKFIDNQLKEWDSSLVLIVFNAIDLAKKLNIKYDISQMPKNLQELISLAFAVDRQPTHSNRTVREFFEEVGFRTISLFDKTSKILFK